MVKSILDVWQLHLIMLGTGNLLVYDGGVVDFGLVEGPDGASTDKSDSLVS